MRAAALAALAGLMAPLAACQKAPEPPLDQEEGNAVDDAVGEIENVPDDSLAAPDDAINDMESMSGEATGNSGP
jgi:hypothetical protein